MAYEEESEGVNKIVAKAAKAGSVSRAGTTVKGQRPEFAEYWNIGPSLAEISLRYGTFFWLRDPT